MEVRAVSHIAVGVRDMERSLTFYRDHLGLTVSLDRMEPLGQNADGTARERHAVYLRWPGAAETFIVLDRTPGTGQAQPAREMLQPGVHHFAFWVADLDAAHRELLAAGVPCAVAPRTFTSDWYGDEARGFQVRTAYYRDPDGNLIQLDQRLE
jgi:catechol 2,3-dioxygenase-like lactoylglutathione lyase family enzyme